MIFHGIEIDESRLARNYFKEPLNWKESLSEEELRYLFLEKNLNAPEIKEMIGKSPSKLIKFYGLQKTKDQKNECRKRTNLERYGVESPMQLKEFRERAKKTIIEKYGVENVAQSKIIQDKMKATTFERYGVENVSKLEVTKRKFQKTCFEKYGVSNPMQSADIVAKVKGTNLERYGFTCSLQAEEIKAKSIQTNLERYGVKHSLLRKDIQAKIDQTNIKKYGFTRASKLDSVIDKMKKTNQIKYGGNSPLSSSEVTYKQRILNLEKNGCENPKEVLDILDSKEKLKNFLLSFEWEIRTYAFIAPKLCISTSNLFVHVLQHKLAHLINAYTSSYELELKELFPDTFAKTKKIITPYEIDLYSEEHKFGIEFNGDYWHSEQKGVPKDYHRKKSFLAEEKGIFIYHLFEYEWLNPRKQEIIISQLNNLLGRNERKIYARQCELKEVSHNETKEFLEDNHLQGQDISKIRLGLYFGEELVSLMTFVKPRFDKKYQWELSRFCNKKNTSVIGGASKLFKHFLREYDPESILSYSQIAKTRGTLYEKLGFKFDHISDLGYVWINKNHVLSRYQCQKHKLLKQGFEGSSEAEIMENRGYKRVFDCGNKVWVWQKESY